MHKCLVKRHSRPAWGDTAPAQPFLHGPPAIWRPHAWCQEYEAQEVALSARLAAAEDAEGAAAARLEAADARREGARAELGAAQQRAAEVAQRRAARR
jgi:hypothetical protein